MSSASTSAEPKPAILHELPVLRRQDLISMARLAGAELSAPGKEPARNSVLSGRRFLVVIPFGCGGIQTSPTNSQVSVNYDPVLGTVKLIAQPGDWTALSPIQSITSPNPIETAEGFWIPHPWTSSEDCPPPNTYFSLATPTPVAGPTLGLVQISRSGDPRIPVHIAHPYEFSRKVTAGEASVLSHSYRLVLQGNVSSFADGRALRCWAESPDHHPVCVYAVRFDKVTLKDGDTGEILATWTP
jgi:hypothetical protein